MGKTIHVSPSQLRSSAANIRNAVNGKTLATPPSKNACTGDVVTEIEAIVTLYTEIHTEILNLANESACTLEKIANEYAKVDVNLRNAYEALS